MREAIHAFQAEGLGCLEHKSSARRDEQRAFDDAARERLRQLLLATG